MSDSLKDKLISMLSGTDDKKLTDAVDKAMQLMKNNNLSDLSSLLGNKNKSKASDEAISPELMQLIDKLPDSKKMALWEKFNSSEVQEAMKTDKNRAIEMLKKTITG
jgi:hypothetical protein